MTGRRRSWKVHSHLIPRLQQDPQIFSPLTFLVLPFLGLRFYVNLHLAYSTLYLELYR